MGNKLTLLIWIPFGSKHNFPLEKKHLIPTGMIPETPPRGPILEDEDPNLKMTIFEALQKNQNSGPGPGCGPVL
eukprot:7403658-Karenia_brevis.AAC.1